MLPEHATRSAEQAMWQSMVSHAWPGPLREGVDWIIGWLLSVLFKYGDGPSTPS
jgi:hypothetical protein